MIAYVKNESNRGGNESKCDATDSTDRIPGNRINRRGTSLIIETKIVDLHRSMKKKKEAE